jgi:hypothetical protein
MSQCKIVTFKDGQADSCFEFGNSWLGAASIWTAMFDRFVKDPLKEYDSWLMCCRPGENDARAGQFWNLWQRADIPDALRAVHLATLDHAIVMAADFGRFSADLRTFAESFALPHSHLAKWAECITGLTFVEAIGFHHTTVTENPWCSYDEKQDRMIPYKLSEGTHFSVYEKLNAQPLS